MDLNIALNNFKRAYNDLIDALDENGIPKPQIVEREGKQFSVISDLGKFTYTAKNKDHAVTQFRSKYGYNHIRIYQVKEES